MDVNVPCQTLCNDVKLTKDQSATLAKRIRNNYYVHLYEEFSKRLNRIEYILLDLLTIFHVQRNFRMLKHMRQCTNMDIVLAFIRSKTKIYF